MRQIAKWTFLCMIGTAFGFGATYMVAHSDRMIQAVVAMLPVTSQAAPHEAAVDELAAVDAQAVEVNTVELAGIMAAAQRAAKVPLAAADSTVGTFAAGEGGFSADMAQTTPVTGPLNAVGVVEVTRDRQVVLGANGRVDEIAIEVGDEVSAGDLLISLDTTYLDWAVEEAEIAFENARIDFEEAGEAVDAADIAVAEANLLLAQETLAEIEAGPTAEQLTAAESTASAAWARLEDLQAGPNPNEIILAQADLRRAEIAIQAAQREYDKIAWLPEAAATAAADNLQDATINLEAARAAYSETVEPPTVAEIQAAFADAQSAQDALNELLTKPTPAELAAAQAAVAEAEAALEDVLEGPQQGALRQAELGVRLAMIALEDARLAQANAEVFAPIDGTVLALNVDLGQQASVGDVVAVLADTTNVKLTVNVEQRDIARVRVGQEVQISVYTLATDSFTGMVEKIAPIADDQASFVTFPVIIRFTRGPMEKILPGMTASATFTSATSETITPVATAEMSTAATATPLPEMGATATPSD